MVEIINENNFDEFISNDLVLVDFFANWCGPCKMLAPNVEKLSNEENIKCGKVDVDQNMTLAERFNISSIPLLILFKNGQMIAKSLGYIDYTELKEFINLNK